MKHIDERRLESDLSYRFAYLVEFIGFGEQDVQAVHGAAGALAPLVPSLVDAVYDKLFGYDATKRHFLPRQSGYEGAIPTDLASLTQEHEMIQFRKQHLGRYLVTLVTKPYDGTMVGYLDMVGKIHTPKAGSKELNVPLVQMNALLGFVSDALVHAVLSLNLPRLQEVATLRAFNKLLWIQNDLITRHYQDAHSVAAK
ncbi:MAG: protoglobin family protein [Candidatus Saccharimonas sp.]|nr:protoglobin family protein [Planctomycetaceae bacterium]